MVESEQTKTDSNLTLQDCLLKAKWLRTRRRWQHLNLDSVLRASGFLLLISVFWVLCFAVVTKLCESVSSLEVIGPIILGRLVSFGFLATFIVVTMGHILTAHGTLFRALELSMLFTSPYPIPRMYRIQCIETLILGCWVSGMFCIPIILAYGWNLHAVWWYYPVVLAGLVGFLIVSGTIGVMLMLSIARWIAGRPIRTIMGSTITILAFIALILVTASSNRDLLSNPDFNQLGEALANLKLSSSPYLPSHWIASLMLNAQSGNLYQAFLYFLMIWSTALFFWYVVLELGHHWYSEAWLWTQDRVGPFHKKHEKRKFKPKKLWLNKLLPRSTASIIYKEMHVFTRDFSQWGQLVLILALVLFYVAHTQNLVFDEDGNTTRSQLAFINVILLGFIQATLSLRYTFPTISLEGRAFWVITSSKIGFSRFFFTKYFLHTIILLIIGLGMGFVLNRILGIDPTLNKITLSVLFFFAFGFTSWSMGFGSVFRKFEATSASDVTSDTGALVTMILTLLYYGASIALIASFAMHYYSPGMDIVSLMALNPDIIVLGALFLFVQTCAIILPAAYGLKKLEDSIL